MKDVCSTGELVRIIRMIDTTSQSKLSFNTPELEAYARRLVKEFLC